MSQSSYKRIYVGPQVNVINLIDALKIVKIIPVIKDHSESARLAGFGSFSRDQEVWVHPDEFDAAQQILKNLSH